MNLAASDNSPQIGIRPPSASGSQQHARKPLLVGANAADVTKTKGKAKEKISAKDRSSSKEAMPPPPDPPKPQAILEPEICALEECLVNATVSIAQIFGFYSDVERLKVQRHAPRPPRSMISALELDLARYDQICDTLETRISHAISVLERDLRKEENRMHEEEEERARAKAAEPTPSIVNTDLENATDEMSKSLQTSPSGAVIGTSSVPLRRPSKVTLSTLHRNPFPLKLDLSAASLRMGSEEAGFDMSALGNMGTLGGMDSLGRIPGLASPVTLAPKSARPLGPGELPPDLFAALTDTQNLHQQIDIDLTQDQDTHIDIDLTLDDNVPVSSGMDMLSQRGSADKPIDLDDLDLDDVHMQDLASSIFNQHDHGVAPGSSDETGVDSLFSPAVDAPELSSDNSGVDSILHALSENHPQQVDIFGSLTVGQEGSTSASSNNTEENPMFPRTVGETGSTGFDYSQLDMNHFFNEQGDEMMNLLNMGSSIVENEDNDGGTSGREFK